MRRSRAGRSLPQNPERDAATSAQVPSSSATPARWSGSRPIQPAEETVQLGLAGVIQIIEVDAAVGHFPEVEGLDPHELAANRCQALPVLQAQVLKHLARRTLGAMGEVVGGQLDLGLTYAAQGLLLGRGLRLVVDLQEGLQQVLVAGVFVLE